MWNPMPPLFDGRSVSSSGNEGQDAPYHTAARAAPFAFVSILWLGVLLGVSFLATPVKFQAPSLDLPVALEVGRVTFALFAKIEWLLGLSLAAVAVLSCPPRSWLPAGVAVLMSLLAVQALWLLPVLDARVGHVIAGAALPATSHHLLYVATDAAKALILIALSVSALRRLAATGETG